jgi:hypothetical protein
MFGIPKLYTMLGVASAFALLLAWGLRVDHLRAEARVQTKAEIAAHVATKNSYRVAQAISSAKQAAEKERIETQWKANANDAQTTIRNHLDIALASLRAQTRAGAASRGSGAYQTGIAASPADIGRAGSMPELDAAQFTDDDMRICTINTVKAHGWQGFYGGQIMALNPIDQSAD